MSNNNTGKKMIKFFGKIMPWNLVILGLQKLIERIIAKKL
jgi:hypothetical protein